MENMANYILMSITHIFLNKVKTEDEIPAKMREVAAIYEKHVKVLKATADAMEKRSKLVA
jgi:hypothetical protein